MAVIPHDQQPSRRGVVAQTLGDYAARSGSLSSPAPIPAANDASSLAECLGGDGGGELAPVGAHWDKQTNKQTNNNNNKTGEEQSFSHSLVKDLLHT